MLLFTLLPPPDPPSPDVMIETFRVHLSWYVHQASNSVDLVPSARVEAARTVLARLNALHGSSGAKGGGKAGGSKGGKRAPGASPAPGPALTAAEVTELLRALVCALGVDDVECVPTGSLTTTFCTWVQASAHHLDSLRRPHPPSRPRSCAPLVTSMRLSPPLVHEPRECCVCMEPQTEATCRLLRHCRHALCQDCVVKITAEAPGGTAHCPLCRDAFKYGDPQSHAHQSLVMTPIVVVFCRGADSFPGVCVIWLLRLSCSFPWVLDKHMPCDIVPCVS